MRLEVGRGALESVNVLNALATQLVGDPGVGPDRRETRCARSRPIRCAATARPSIDCCLAVDGRGGRLRADDLQIAAKEFALAASGAVGLDGLLDGDGRIRFSPELSKKILKKADRFAPLLADGDIVVLPLRLGRQALGAVRCARTSRRSSSHAREVATEELTEKVAKKLTDAIFGKKKKKKDRDGDPSTDADAAGEGTAEEPSQKDLDRDAAKDLVKEGLGRLLGN